MFPEKVYSAVPFHTIRSCGRVTAYSATGCKSMLLLFGSGGRREQAAIKRALVQKPDTSLHLYTKAWFAQQCFLVQFEAEIEPHLYLNRR